MKNRLKFRSASFLFIIMASLFFAGAAKAQSSRAADFAADGEDIRKLLAEHKIPLLGLGLISEGRLTRVKVFGKLNSGEPAPANRFSTSLR